MRNKERMLGLKSAIRALCPDIFNRIQDSAANRKSELDLLKELSCCLLSSQVRYETAVAATSVLAKEGFLSLPYYKENYRWYEARIRMHLAKPMQVEGRKLHYRFPNVRANQLAMLMKNLMKNDSGVSDILYSNDSSILARQAIVDIAPGVGLKQASMFLRNVGYSYDIAILDKHVIDFMTLSEMVAAGDIRKLGSQYYGVAEQKLIGFSEELGYPVGCVDWAIWIVMRVAKRERYI